MPRHLVVEHCLQEESQGCLAACAQIVLRFFGVRRTQRELNRLFGLTVAGVPASRILRLSQFGVTAVYKSGYEQVLSTTIEQGNPLIAFVFTGDLPYWQANLRHAVVVIGFDAQFVQLLDPAFSDHPKQVAWGDFLLAWSEFDYRYAIISKA